VIKDRTTSITHIRFKTTCFIAAILHFFVTPNCSLVTPGFQGNSKFLSDVKYLSDGVFFGVK
jgi:hypothetical protein